MRRWLMASLFALLLGLVLAATMLSQRPAVSASAALQATATIDARAVLDKANAAAVRADDVAKLADQAAKQTNSTIDLMQKLVWAVGIAMAIVGIPLTWLGISAQRGFREIQKEYRTKLEESNAAYQASLEKVRATEADLQDQVQKVHTAIAEIDNQSKALREQVASMSNELDNTKQALLLLSEGNRLVSEGNWQQAIPIYEEARSLSPEHAEINYRLGRAYSNTGRYEDAINTLEQALHVKRDFAEANMELGLVYRRRAERAPSDEERTAGYRQAERYLQQAIALRPDYEDALGSLGGLYRREGRYEDALRYYQRAADVDPNSSYALGNVASLAWYLGQTERARAYFERVEAVASSRIRIGREPIYWDLYDRALARLALGRREEAGDDHEKAIARTPGTENASSVLDNLRFLARAETRMEGLDEFITMLEQKFPQLNGQADTAPRQGELVG